MALFEDTLRRFEQVINDPGSDLRLNEIAREMRVSPSVVSQWKDNNYAGNMDRVTALVAAWIGRWEERRDAPKPLPFGQTQNAVKVLRAIKQASAIRTMVLVVGPTGCGKTAAARHWQRSRPEVLYIHLPTGCTMSTFAGLLAHELDVRATNQVGRALWDCGQLLGQTGRTLVLNEITRVDWKMLHAIRDVQEIANCGVVLLATPPFYATLRARRGDLAEFLNRVYDEVQLDPITSADVSVLVPGVTPEQAGQIAARCRGDARTLNNAWMAVQAGGKVPTPEALLRRIPEQPALLGHLKETK
jgi:DNA transposition AAA+ family ATPase